MAILQHPKPSSRTFATLSMSTGASGASEVINISGLTLSCIQMSTAWTDARIGFQGDVNASGNYYDIYDTNGDFLTFATSASRIIVFDPAVFAGIQILKLVSETSAGVAVAQAATRTFRLGLAEYVKAD